MKVVVATFNQEKALVGAFSVITNLRMELFEALVATRHRTWPMGCYTLLPCAGAWDLLQSVYKLGTVAVAVFSIQAARTIIIITIAIAFCLP